MKTNVSLMLFAVLVLLMSASCKKEDPASAPDVATDSASMVQQYSAFLFGAVMDENGSAVTTRGFCYSADPDPDLDDEVELSGFGPGAFSSEITGLQPGNTYYYRAFATNGIGTSFGEILNLATEQISDPGPSIVLKGGQGYVSSDVTIAPGDVIRIGITCQASPVTSAKLTRFKLSITNNDLTTVPVDINPDSGTYIWDQTLTFTSAGINTIKFEVTDANGMTGSITLVIIVEAETEVARYNNIELGSTNDPYGSFFSTSEGVVYTISQTYAAPANQAKIDFLFFKGITNANTIASPDDADANTIVELKLSQWTHKNQTRFNPTNITAAQFDAIGDNYEFPAFNMEQQTTKMNNLTEGQVLLFKTHNNKLGLVKVIDLYNRGDRAKVSVIVQK